LETGRISEEDFVKSIKGYFSVEVKDDQILSAWNALLLDFTAERIKYIKALQQKCPVFLLSNTNVIHAKQFEEDFKKNFTEEDWQTLFDKIYYSFEVGMRKPNSDIFLHLLKEQQFQPEEGLFVDDTLMHIETAKKIGLKTHHLQDDEEIHEVLPRILAEFNQ